MENEKLTPEEALRADNEIKALDLEINFDATTFISDDAPPELIAAFLDNVKKNEGEFQNAEMVDIYEFIGKPKFAPIDLLETDEQFETEIERLQALFLSKRVFIDRPEFLRPKAYYRFLVNDFFAHQLRNYTGKTIMHTFAYHEFYQDGPEFIGFHAQAVIEDLLHLAQPYSGQWLAEECRSDRDVVPKAVILQKINAFRKKYKKIIPVAFQAEGIHPTDTAMYFMFLVKWDGILVNGGAKESHEGMGICQLQLNEERQWMVEGVQMPGFEF